MTRIGKIARLPHLIRQQINRRLQNGWKARQILQWLNALPEVAALMAARQPYPHRFWTCWTAVPLRTPKNLPFGTVITHF